MLTEKQVVKRLNTLARDAGGKTALWAELGKPCSLSFFHDVLAGKRGLSKNLAKKLGFEKIILFDCLKK